MRRYYYKEYDFEIIDYNSKFNVYCPSECVEWLKQKSWGDFLNFQEELLDELLGLNFDIKDKFSIMIVPKGEEFKDITNKPYESGICDAKLNDDRFLVFDDLIAERSNYKDIAFSFRKMLLHEWAHMIVYKYNNKLSHTLNEGLADLIPLYILDYQNDMPEYVERLKALKIDDIVSIDYIDEYDVLDDDLSTLAQNKNTYLSCYLFVLNIIKNIEVKFNLSKLDALKFFLELMKKHEEYHYEVISEILDLSLEKLKFNEFQLEALKHI